jgi:hypothetical protein
VAAGFGKASMGDNVSDGVVGVGAGEDSSGAGATPKDSLGGATGFSGADAAAVSAWP